MRGTVDEEVIVAVTNLVENFCEKAFSIRQPRELLRNGAQHDVGRCDIEVRVHGADNIEQARVTPVTCWTKTS